MEEEVVLGCTVGQGAVVRVAHRLVKGEENWLAGVDRGGGLAISSQRSHRAEDICSDRTGHVVKPAIWRQEKLKALLIMLTKCLTLNCS